MRLLLDTHILKKLQENIETLLIGCYFVKQKLKISIL